MAIETGLQKTICSIFFLPLDATRNYKKYDDSTGYGQHFHIDACKPGEYKLLTVYKSYQRTYIGEGRYNDLPVYADDRGGSVGLASDLVMEWADNVLGGSGDSRPGVFVCAGELPTADELAAAEAKQTRWCDWQCRIADEDWIAGRKTSVTSLQRACAVWLGRTDYPWVSEQQGPSRLKTCPVCAKDIQATALKCAFCQSVVDFDGMAAYMDRVEKLSARSGMLPGDLLKPPLAPPISVGGQKKAAV